MFQKLNLIEALTAEENILLAGYFAGGNMAELKKRAAMLLERVGLANKKDTLPGKLSIGEQQRIAVVRAVINKPVLLLADEPTSALDVTTQAQIIRQIVDVCNEYNAAVILVTHNIGVASYVSNKLMVMKNGHVVESGGREIIENPQHAYTKELLAAVPVLGDKKYYER